MSTEMKKSEDSLSLFCFLDYFLFLLRRVTVSRADRVRGFTIAFMCLRLFFSFFASFEESQSDELEKSKDSLSLEEDSSCQDITFKLNLPSSFRTCFWSFGFCLNVSIVTYSVSESDLLSTSVVETVTFNLLIAFAVLGLASLSLDLDCEAVLLLGLTPGLPVFVGIPFISRSLCFCSSSYFFIPSSHFFLSSRASSAFKHFIWSRISTISALSCFQSKSSNSRSIICPRSRIDDLDVVLG